MAVRVPIPGYYAVRNPDPRLTDGHLLLATPGREGGGRTGTKIPNLAFVQAQSRVGSPVQELTLWDDNTSTAQGLWEETPKGAIHFMSSKTVDTETSGAGAIIPQALADWFSANGARNLFMGVWLKWTRPYTGSSPAVWPVAAVKDLNLNGTVFGVGQTTAVNAGIPGSSSPDRVGFTTQVSGDELLVGITTTGTNATSVITDFVRAGGWSGATVHHSPSFVLRSVSVVDVASSGLAHSSLFAAERTEWEDALTAGYYAGDTNRDPAVVCP